MKYTTSDNPVEEKFWGKAVRLQDELNNSKQIEVHYMPSTHIAHKRITVNAGIFGLITHIKFGKYTCLGCNKTMDFSRNWCAVCDQENDTHDPYEGHNYAK